MMDQKQTPANDETVQVAPQSGGGNGGAAPVEPAAAGEASVETAGDVTAQEQIAALEAEMVKLKDQAIRALADAENTRRRAVRERDDTAKFAVASFAKELLSVSDNLRRALDAIPNEARQTDELLNKLFEGVEATERQLLGAFDRFGIKKMEPLGQPFDPNYHQVMFELENTGQPAGVVVQVLQPGYTIHGRLLREAMVGVAKGDVQDTVPQVDTTV